jgi:SAM-dependent methyltransferase
MNGRDPLAVRLVLLINRFTPELNGETIRSKHDVSAYSRFEYGRAASTMRLFGAYFDVAGKDVLDLGCGLGGGERYYAEQGARSVTAVDLSTPRLEAGHAYVREILRQDDTYLLFAASDARRMAFSDNAFDLIVSTNTFEHIFGVEEALRECARILRPGGRLLIALPPYYSPWGAHLSNWIRFPWCHVMFSQKILVAAAKRLEAKMQLNLWMPEAVRLDLDGHDEIPHLNRITVREFETIAARVPLAMLCAECKSIGWRSGGMLQRVGRALRRSHRLREYVTSQAVYVMEKPRS